MSWCHGQGICQFFCSLHLWQEGRKKRHFVRLGNNNVQCSECLITPSLASLYMPRFREDAFVGLESLEWLKLEDNSLTTLGGDELFPKTMKVKNSDIYHPLINSSRALRFTTTPGAVTACWRSSPGGCTWPLCPGWPSQSVTSRRDSRCRLPSSRPCHFMVDAVHTSEMSWMTLNEHIELGDE